MNSHTITGRRAAFTSTLIGLVSRTVEVADGALVRGAVPLDVSDEVTLVALVLTIF
jgi:hypothetical protein